MTTRPRKYIWVNREYFGIGLKPLDILMLSRIEEDTTHNRYCELTNDDFSDMFVETLYSIKKSLKNLRDKNMIIQDERYVSGVGKANRKRYIVLNDDNGMKLMDKLDEYIENTKPKKRRRKKKHY